MWGEIQPNRGLNLSSLNGRRKGRYKRKKKYKRASAGISTY
jgi:hypothetical protein